MKLINRMKNWIVGLLIRTGTGKKLLLRKFPTFSDGIASKITPVSHNNANFKNKQGSNGPLI